jgi:hypothetical protein
MLHTATLIAEESVRLDTFAVVLFLVAVSAWAVLDLHGRIKK